MHVMEKVLVKSSCRKLCAHGHRCENEPVVAPSLHLHCIYCHHAYD